MNIRILILLIFGVISLSSLCFAQAREPGNVSQSSSTGALPPITSGSSGESGDHGSSGTSSDLGSPATTADLGNQN